VALGWLASPALAGTHHGADSVLMVWLCACSVAVPQGSASGKVEVDSDDGSFRCQRLPAFSNLKMAMRLPHNS
jgi:hypothetical protein